jgi:YkoY family integral membrane protein
VPHQTFALADLWVICVLVMLEGLLSADNVLILAMMVRHLPANQQKNALTYGLGGAFCFRAIAIGLASFFFQLWWLQLGGALYLLYLTVKHLRGSAEEDEVAAARKSFWRTVVSVEFTDIAFAADSVLAGVGMVHDRHKLWVVYSGSVIGVVMLRFVSQAILSILKRFPLMDKVAYGLVGWVGFNLLLSSLSDMQMNNSVNLPLTIPVIPTWAFWVGMGLIAVGGTVLATRKSLSEA